MTDLRRKGVSKVKKYKLWDYKHCLKLTFTLASDTTLNFKKKDGKATEETQERLKRRAKAKVLEYALCNDWQYFFTQTINGSRWDRSATDTINKIKKTLKNCGIKYLLCVDRHKDGALHLHGLINVSSDRLKDSGVTAINKTTKERQPVFNLLPTTKYGYNSCFEIKTNKIEDKIKIAHYISGYITKDNNQEFKHRYFASKGLSNKSEIYIENKAINEYIANNGLIPDYESKYSSIYNLSPTELPYIPIISQEKQKSINDLKELFGNLVKVI